MSDTPQTQPPGWYYAQGDPPGTQRYWDGERWEGGPQPVPGTPQDLTSGAPLAEPLNRIGARIIDGIIWIVISFIIGAIFGVASFAASGDTDVSFGASLIAGLVGTALVAAYEIGFLANRGATPGKMALGLKVTREDGSAVDVRDATMRLSPYLVLSVLGAFLSTVGLLAFLLGMIQLGIAVVSLIFLFTDARRQAVWDKIAKTVVVATK